MDELIEKIVDDVTWEFQIPPYFPQEALINYVKEGIARLKFLNPEGNLERDETYKMLVKNYAYYAYHHKVNAWEENYADTILSWILGNEVTE